MDAQEKRICLGVPIRRGEGPNLGSSWIVMLPMFELMNSDMAGNVSRVIFVLSIS